MSWLEITDKPEVLRNQVWNLLLCIWSYQQHLNNNTCTYIVISHVSFLSLDHGSQVSQLCLHFTQMRKVKERRKLNTYREMLQVPALVTAGILWELAFLFLICYSSSATRFAILMSSVLEVGGILKIFQFRTVPRMVCGPVLICKLLVTGPQQDNFGSYE